MRVIRLLTALAALTACRATAPRPAGLYDYYGVTTIIVVRHAEKASEPPVDPPLTATGVARAQALSDYVRALPVAAIISTDFVRTRATAAPLAARLGLAPEIVDARARDHARAVADGILAHHRGQTVVVVGHSNTVPDIVAALGAPRPANICDGEYDNLYVVRVLGGRDATVERRTYGAPSAVDASCRAMK